MSDEIGKQLTCESERRKIITYVVLEEDAGFGEGPGQSHAVRVRDAEVGQAVDEEERVVGDVARPLRRVRFHVALEVFRRRTQNPLGECSI